MSETYINKLGEIKADTMNSLFDSETPSQNSFGSDKTHFNLKGASIHSSWIVEELRKLNLKSVKSILSPDIISDSFEDNLKTIDELEGWKTVLGSPQSHILQSGNSEPQYGYDDLNFYSGFQALELKSDSTFSRNVVRRTFGEISKGSYICLLYTSPSPRDRQKSRMPSSA